MDKYITTNQIKVILDNAPKGVDKAELLKKFDANGYKIQGYNDQVEEETPKGETGLKGVATGFGKGILSTVKGAGQLGEKIGGGILGGVEKLTGLPVKPEDSVYSDEATKDTILSEENLTPQTTAEKIGKFGEQVAEFAIPATKLANASKGLGLAKTIGTRALTSGTVASIQAGDVGKEAGIAAGVETALPLTGKFIVKPALRLTSRLFKGLASGVSGVGTDTIEQIVQNPKTAKETVKILNQGGNKAVLEKNAKTIIDGVSNVRKEARQAYGDALESLAKTDIQPKTFRDSVQATLDKFGSKVEGSTRMLDNVEFNDPVNLKKASAIIDRVSNTELDGKSLKKVLDYIGSKRYSIATTDERLAYNAFVGDMEKAVKNAISKSTDKLTDMNAKYSADMQLTEAIEGIFGKVKFKNSKELNKVSQQLETLFSKKGLSPEYIDDFLTRIGVGVEDFKTSEAVRQISGKVTGANTKGLSIGELIQQATSSVVTPKLVRNIAIATGKTESVIQKLLANTAPSARGALIKSLFGSKEEVE